MSYLQMIQNFMKADGLQKASMTVLKPGSLVYGKVDKFLGNDRAIIQIGTMKLMAELQTSLPLAENYVFEIQSNGSNGIRLKVLEGYGVQPTGLLDQLQLPNTKKNAQLLQFLNENNIPFTKEQVKLAELLISNQPDTKELTALAWMAKKDLPFTKSIFQSLLAVQDPHSFSSQIEELTNLLDNPKFASYQTTEPLKQMLDSILHNQFIDQLGTGSDLKQMLQTMIQSLGLEYEKEIGIWLKDQHHLPDTLHSLKPLLISALEEFGSNGREIEKLLDRLTGMQLITQDPTGPIQQMVLHLPVFFGNRRSDVTLQWEGKKKSNGQIDSEYCRIIVYLDLQHIRQTIIAINIQNRVIHLTVINEMDDIEPIVYALTPKLKQQLEGQGYQLSFIKVIPPDKVSKELRDRNPINFSTEAKQGVDIKI